jgi:hypothetical protein
MSTETITGPPITTLHALAVAHLAALEEQRLAAEEEQWTLAAQRAAEEVRESVFQAVAYVGKTLPRTLHRIVAEADWTGYPSLSGLATRTAAAALGHGVWALFHRDSLGTAQLLLALPCACGNYVTLDCPSDTALAVVLVDVATWQIDVATCTQACTDGSTPQWGTRDGR